MIKPVEKSDLADCLYVFHEGYETVAAEFGLTDDNCPDRGRASLPYHKLLADFDRGAMMFGYVVNGKIVGFLGITKKGDDVFKLNDIVVLPEHRQQGIGKALLDFCKSTAKNAGAAKITLGMIDDNGRLKGWYEANGFVHTGIKQYEGAPFTVGYMECLL